VSIFWNNLLIPFDPESDVANVTKWVKDGSRLDYFLQFRDLA